MDMKKIRSSQLKPGMIFDQALYTDPGQVFVDAYQQIFMKDIEKLAKEGIMEVETLGTLVNTQKGSQRGGQSLDSTKTSSASGSSATISSATTPLTTTAASANDRESAASPPSSVKSLKASSFQADIESIKQRCQELGQRWKQFHELLTRMANIVQVTISALIHGRDFEREIIMKLAQEIAEKVAGEPLLLIAPQFMRISPVAGVHHTIHAACYGILLANILAYPLARIQDLVFAILFMDIGIYKIPRSIQEKTVELSEEEWRLIKTHPLIGYQLLGKVRGVEKSILMTVLQHQERFDGSGYPQGLKNNQIEESARLVAICDTYTAMIEKRNWRQPYSPHEAIKNMLSQQAGCFDSQQLRTFFGALSIYPPGSLLYLNNKYIGIVVAINSQEPLKPILRLLRDENGKQLPSTTYLNLAAEEKLGVAKAVSLAVSGINPLQEF